MVRALKALSARERGGVEASERVPQISEEQSLRNDLRGSRTVRDEDIIKSSFGDKRDRANCSCSVFDFADSCGTGRVSGSEKLLLSEQPYLFFHWGARLAFLRPYFLRSTTRASRVR